MPSATTIEPNLALFPGRHQIPSVCLVLLEGRRNFEQYGIRCVPARQFLRALA